LEEALKGGLSGLGKTASNRTVAYTRLSLAEKEIERLFPVVLRFKEVRYLDLNTNAIADVSLVTQFPHLLWLNASKNQVNSLTAFSQ
jgi:Leucine-rich repeat (LRR) protein